MREYRKNKKVVSSEEVEKLQSKVEFLQGSLTKLEEEKKQIQIQLEEEIASKRSLSKRLQELTVENFSLQRQVFESKNRKSVHFGPEVNEIDEIDEFEITSSSSWDLLPQQRPSLEAKRTRSGANFGKKKKQVVPSRIEDMEEEEVRFSEETLGELLQDPRYAPHRSSSRHSQVPERHGNLFNYE